MSDDVHDWPIFSYSQLQTWDRCELSWKLGYKDKWTRADQPIYLSKGTMIHTGMELYYNGRKNKQSSEEILTCIELYFNTLMSEALENNATEMVVAISDAMRCVYIYAQAYAPAKDAGHKILATEHHFTVPFTTGAGRNFILQGYIDLLTEYKGRLWSWDHKSSEMQFWTTVEVEMDPQLPMYSVALREQGLSVFGNIINMFNTYNYKDYKKVTPDKLFRREDCYRTERQLNTVQEEMCLLVDDLLDNYEMVRRSLRRDCKRCQFHDPCMMSMKGIDPIPFLKDRFIQKQDIPVVINLEPKNVQTGI